MDSGEGASWPLGLPRLWSRPEGNVSRTELSRRPDAVPSPPRPPYGMRTNYEGQSFAESFAERCPRVVAPLRGGGHNPKGRSGG